MSKNFHKNKYNSGVTLIELLVVIFIFMIISSITIFSYGKFNSSLSIQNLADDIALTVRRAQGYAIGVRGYGDSFSKGYGIHFTANIGSSYAGSNKSFILFADANSDKKYDYNDSDTCDDLDKNECIEVLNIISADEIKSITLNDGEIDVPSAGSIDILFKRPNPEPNFCYRSDIDHSDCDREGNDISNIKIKISNIGNSEVYKTITISNNGQISVQ